MMIASIGTVAAARPKNAGLDRALPLCAVCRPWWRGHAAGLAAGWARGANADPAPYGPVCPQPGKSASRSGTPLITDQHPGFSRPRLPTRDPRPQCFPPSTVDPIPDQSKRGDLDVLTCYTTGTE